MGGFGSGRRAGSGRQVVEACHSLDVGRLQDAGCLAPGWSGSWQWTEDGQQIGTIGLRAEAEHIILTYQYRFTGGAWENVQQLVPVVRLPCRFGGSRPYFLCLGAGKDVACGRRAAKLYGPGRYFLCRHCHRLAYASQGESKWGRALRRASKIRLRLGGQPGVASRFPRKPRGMWWRTYERLGEKALTAEAEAMEAMTIKTTRLARGRRHSSAGQQRRGHPY